MLKYLSSEEGGTVGSDSVLCQSPYRSFPLSGNWLGVAAAAFVDAAQFEQRDCHPLCSPRLGLMLRLTNKYTVHVLKLLMYVGMGVVRCGD